MGSENTHYFLSRTGQRRTKSRVKKAEVIPRWKIRILIKFVALLNSLAHRHFRQARDLVGRLSTDITSNSSSEADLPRFTVAFDLQEWRIFRIPLSFKTVRKDIFIVHDDRQRWDGTEYILSKGRKINTNQQNITKIQTTAKAS